MKKSDKKMAAALAAVNLYLQEEAQALAAMDEAANLSASRVSSDPSQWVLASRLDMMTANRMVQMRAFSRAR